MSPTSSKRFSMMPSAGCVQMRVFQVVLGLGQFGIIAFERGFGLGDILDARAGDRQIERSLRGLCAGDRRIVAPFGVVGLLLAGRLGNQLDDPVVGLFRVLLGCLSGFEIGLGLADFLGPRAGDQPRHDLPLGFHLGLGAGLRDFEPFEIEPGQQLPLLDAVSLFGQQFRDAVVAVDRQLHFADVDVAVQRQMAFVRLRVQPLPDEKPAGVEGGQHGDDQQAADPGMRHSES
jgi:hypothetical protein